MLEALDLAKRATTDSLVHFPVAKLCEDVRLSSLTVRTPSTREACASTCGLKVLHRCPNPPSRGRRSVSGANPLDGHRNCSHLSDIIRYFTSSGRTPHDTPRAERKERAFPQRKKAKTPRCQAAPENGLHSKCLDEGEVGTEAREMNKENRSSSAVGRGTRRAR